MEFQKFNKIPRLSRDIVISEKIDGTNGQIVIMRRQDLHNSFFTEWNQGVGTDEAMKEFIDKYCLYKTLAMTDENDILYMFAGSRTRWLSVDSGKNCDNHGFARWVKENAEELLKLGKGRHFGEFYGKGINRNYGLDEKRLALFNVKKWHQHNKEKRLISINSKTKEEKYTSPAPKCCKVVPILYEGMFNTITIDTILMRLKMEGSKAVPGFMNAEGICIYHTASGHLYKKTILNDEKPKGQS